MTAMQLPDPRGSGRTHRMLTALLDRVKSGDRPGRIWVLACSDHAAKDLQDRFRKLLDADSIFYEFRESQIEVLRKTDDGTWCHPGLFKIDFTFAGRLNLSWIESKSRTKEAYVDHEVWRQLIQSLIEDYTRWNS